MAPIVAQVAGGSLTLEDDGLVFTWNNSRGRLTWVRLLYESEFPDLPSDAGEYIYRLSWEHIRVVQVVTPKFLRTGEIRFGPRNLPIKWSGIEETNLGRTELGNMYFDKGDLCNPELLAIVQAVVDRIGVPNPLATLGVNAALSVVNSDPEAPDIEPGPAQSVESGASGEGGRVRSFEVHALGPSGSGKTVFMASLYSRLRIRRPDLAFYLSSDHASSLHLNTVLNKVANPDENWPEASQTTQEWRFTARVSSPSGDFEPLEFVYLDYPGGILTNPRAAEDESIQPLIGRLRSANALLVLLDGQALLALMRGERAGDRYFEFDVTSSLEIAQQSRCPVHFVITKWDLLEGSYSLADVRDRLLQDENFADLVAAKSQDMPASIRLFPVSAVGSGFAEPLPTGEMRKTGARMRPQNVELPLIAVLPDFFQFAYDQMRTDSVADLPATERSGLATWLADGENAPRLRGWVLRALPKVRDALARQSPWLASLQPVDTDAFVDRVVGFAQGLVRGRLERAEAGRAAYAQSLMRQRQNVDSEQTALELLTLQFEQLLSDFEVANPASVLAGGLEPFEPYLGESDATAARADAVGDTGAYGDVGDIRYAPQLIDPSFQAPQ